MNAKTPVPLKVERIAIKNFLGIRELDLTPDGKLNFITGKNGAGKSTILKALEKAFDGFSGKEQILTQGETSGEIIVELNKFNIRRGFTESGKTLSVTNDGMKYSSPQAVLDKFVGEFAFNPIEFAFADQKKRRNILLNAVDVSYTLEDATNDGLETKIFEDVSELDEIEKLSGLELIDAIYKALYDKRQDLNRKVKSAKVTLQELKDSLPEDFEAYDEKKHSKARSELDEVETQISGLRSEIMDLETVIEKETEWMETMKKRAESLQFVEVNMTDKTKEGYDKVKGLQEQLDKLQARKEELRGIDDAMRESMKHFEVQAKINDYEKRIPNGEKKASDLDDKIEKIRKEIKPRLIGQADLGVEGLEFVENDVLVDGVQIENLSESEKLRIGVKIAQKLNSEFGIICIDGVEKLDPESLEEFTEELAKTGFQSFLTSCWGETEDGKNIKMKDGAVSAE